MLKTSRNAIIAIIVSRTRGKLEPKRSLLLGVGFVEAQCKTSQLGDLLINQRLPVW